MDRPPPSAQAIIHPSIRPPTLMTGKMKTIRVPRIAAAVATEVWQAASPKATYHSKYPPLLVLHLLPSMNANSLTFCQGKANERWFSPSLFPPPSPSASDVPKSTALATQPNPFVLVLHLLSLVFVSCSFASSRTFLLASLFPFSSLSPSTLFPHSHHRVCLNKHPHRSPPTIPIFFAKNEINITKIKKLRIQR